MSRLRRSRRMARQSYGLRSRATPEAVKTTETEAGLRSIQGRSKGVGRPVFPVWPDGFYGRQFVAPNTLKTRYFLALPQLWKTGWNVCIAMHKWARRNATNPGG